MKLSLAESGAVALEDAADELNAASDSHEFLSALDFNHRLWLALTEIARDQGWTWPDRRQADFVVNITCRAGRGVRDDDVEALISINRELSRTLAAGRDLDGIRRRVVLAWRERGSGYGIPLDAWLLAEMRRKAHIHVH
ncbi:MAG: flagellar biosynthesis regulator FlaF [Actinomycetota bacterium]